MHLLHSQSDGSGLSRERRSLLAAAVLVPVLWSAGCAPAKPLVLAGHPWPGYEPMFLPVAWVTCPSSSR